MAERIAHAFRLLFQNSTSLSGKMFDAFCVAYYSSVMVIQGGKKLSEKVRLATFCGANLFKCFAQLKTGLVIE